MFCFRMGRKKCPHVETMEKRMCAGQVSECPSHQGLERVKNPHCAVTSWSDWSPCSVSCGKICVPPFFPNANNRFGVNCADYFMPRV